MGPAFPGLTAAQRIRKQTREAARMALLEAGLTETLALGGLQDPSIEAICARAGYTRGAFYFHFRDREHYDAEMFEWVLNDILSALWANAVSETADIREIVRRFNKRIVRRDWPDLDGDIRAGYLSVLRNIIGGAKEVRDRHATLMGSVVDTLAASLRAGQSEGWVRIDLDPESTGRVLLLTAIASIVWDDIGMEFDMPAIGETIITLLAPTPGPWNGGGRQRASRKNTRSRPARRAEETGGPRQSRSS